MEFVGGEHVCPLFGYMLDQTAGVDWGFTCGGVTCLGVTVVSAVGGTLLCFIVLCVADGYGTS